MSGKSKRVDIPLYICDEHNEAFYYWYKARVDGYIKKPTDIFHIDAHSDMCCADKFKKSLYFNSSDERKVLNYYKEFSQNDLKICNFILPGVLVGLIKNIYLIHPLWREYKYQRKTRQTISTVFGEGIHLRYGIVPDESVKLAFPDMKSYNSCICNIAEIPTRREVILDIDLDYFACRDSISNIHHFDLKITKEQYQQKKAFGQDKRLKFAGLQFKFFKKKENFFVRVSKTPVKEMVHLPDKQQINTEIDRVVKQLVQKKISPQIITICRSCFSGYCPKEYYGYIESNLTGKLKDVFPIIN